MKNLQRVGFDSFSSGRCGKGTLGSLADGLLSPLSLVSFPFEAAVGVGLGFFASPLVALTDFKNALPPEWLPLLPLILLDGDFPDEEARASVGLFVAAGECTSDVGR